jgi:hypothetical protein
MKTVAMHGVLRTGLGFASVGLARLAFARLGFAKLGFARRVGAALRFARLGPTQLLRALLRATSGLAQALLNQLAAQALLDATCRL